MNQRMLRPTGSGAGALCLTLLLAAATAAQTIQPRQISALGSVQGYDVAVHETSIAVGANHAMAVYLLGAQSPAEIGFALAELQNGTWVWVQEGVIDPSRFLDEKTHANIGMTDPSVAADTITGDF